MRRSPGLRISLSTAGERPYAVALLGTDITEKNPVVTTMQYRRAKKARIECGQVKELLMILTEFEYRPPLSLWNFH
jgi:hypothetical protein